MSTQIKKLKRTRNFPFRPLPKGEHGGIELLLVHSVESLGKQGRGATPLTAVETRDLHSRGQQNQDGARDKFINNLIVRTPRTPAIRFPSRPANATTRNWVGS